MNARGARIGSMGLLAFTLAGAAPASHGIAKVRGAYSLTDTGKGIAFFATIIQSDTATDTTSSCVQHPFSPLGVRPLAAQFIIATSPAGQ